MIYKNDALQAEVYTFRSLAGKLFVEGLIQGYGFVLYGSTYSFVPVFADHKLSEDVLKKLTARLIENLIDQFGRPE